MPEHDRAHTARARNEPVVIDPLHFNGFHGRSAWCRIEIILLADGRTAVIATELAENPGTSVTNVAEFIASFVCDQFGIDSEKLIWIEHYGYSSPIAPDERSYDLVTFERRKPESVTWSPAVQDRQPSGWPGYFDEPHWRPMKEQDWHSLGLEPRPSVSYPKR